MNHGTSKETGSLRMLCLRSSLIFQHINRDGTASVARTYAGFPRNKFCSIGIFIGGENRALRVGRNVSEQGWLVHQRIFLNFVGSNLAHLEKQESGGCIQHSRHGQRTFPRRPRMRPRLHGKRRGGVVKPAIRIGTYSVRAVARDQ